MAETANTGTWVDPYPAFNFQVMIGGEAIAHFTHCSEIVIEQHTTEYREAGRSQVVHQIPTITSYGDVTLKYGLTSSTTIWDWFMATVEGRVERKNVTIFLLNSAGTTPVLQWDLINAYPKRLATATLRATAREVAIEEVVLAVEQVRRGRNTQ